MNRICAIIAVIAIIVPASRGVAQTTKPWQLHGTRAG